MNEPIANTRTGPVEIKPEQASDAAGGGDLCSADEYLRLTESFKQAYENLVDFTSHVIERVAGN